MLQKEDYDQIALQFLEAKSKLQNCRTIKSSQKWKKIQEECLQKLSILIKNRVSRYKQFSNYSDLEQEGFEGLLMSLETYDPEKGYFVSWADHYIKTKIFRAANSHSTIKVPMDEIKNIKPLKAAEFPVMIDHRNGYSDFATKEVANILTEAIKELPEVNQKVILMFYGINGIRSYTITDLSKMLDLDKNQLLRIISESKKKIKAILSNYDM